jgi:hypothetical protein
VICIVLRLARINLLPFGFNILIGLGKGLVLSRTIYTRYV